MTKAQEKMHWRALKKLDAAREALKDIGRKQDASELSKIFARTQTAAVNVHLARMGL